MSSCHFNAIPDWLIYTGMRYNDLDSTCWKSQLKLYYCKRQNICSTLFPRHAHDELLFWPVLNSPNYNIDCNSKWECLFTLVLNSPTVNWAKLKQWWIKPFLQYFILYHFLHNIKNDFNNYPDAVIWRALYDFDAINEDDLSFKKGDRMEVEESRWYIVTIVSNFQYTYDTDALAFHCIRHFCLLYISGISPGFF